jgi:type IV secretory pathway TraG/TraD family ATPase VirD4
MTLLVEKKNYGLPTDNNQKKSFIRVLIFVFCVFLISSSVTTQYLASIFAFFRIISVRKAKKHAHLHGSAKWAKKNEIKEMSLFNDDGVYVGAYKDPKKDKITYLRHNGPEHILTFAPTRSGKGVGLVLPTLLSWQESAFILDMKGENWALTSGWRSQYANNRCIRFDPSNPDSSLCDRFNPLEEIRVGTEYEVGDAQNLSLMLVDPLGKGLNDYWSKTAFSLLTGVILYDVLLSIKPIEVDLFSEELEQKPEKKSSKNQKERKVDEVDF